MLFLNSQLFSHLSPTKMRNDVLTQNFTFSHRILKIRITSLLNKVRSSSAMLTLRRMKLKFYIYWEAIHKDIYWLINDQDFNALVWAWTLVYEMWVSVLASHRFGMGSLTGSLPFSLKTQDYGRHIKLDWFLPTSCDPHSLGQFQHMHNIILLPTTASFLPSSTMPSTSHLSDINA
jgi:hypothetical protein